MRFIFRKLTAFAVGLALMAMVQPASAAFNGTLGFVGSTTVTTGSLATQTSYSLKDVFGATPFLTVLTRSGMFATGSPAVPVLASYTSSTLDTTNLVGFTIGNATYGTFTSIATDGMGDVSEIIRQTTNNLDIYFVGNYVGGPVGATPTLASFRISINYSAGPNATVASSLSIPPVSLVPEPASVAMVMTGLCSVGGLAVGRRFRRRTV